MSWIDVREDLPPPDRPDGFSEWLVVCSDIYKEYEIAHYNAVCGWVDQHNKRCIGITKWLNFSLNLEILPEPFFDEKLAAEYGYVLHKSK